MASRKLTLRASKIEWARLDALAALNACTVAELLVQFILDADGRFQLSSVDDGNLPSLMVGGVLHFIDLQGRRAIPVAEVMLCTFVGEPDSPAAVPEHMDGNPWNCAIANLRWSIHDDDATNHASSGAMQKFALRHIALLALFDIGYLEADAHDDLVEVLRVANRVAAVVAGKQLTEEDQEAIKLAADVVRARAQQLGLGHLLAG